MNLRSVDLNLLTIFDAIMAEKNLTRAAEKIGMSQPAMSRALAKLRYLMKDELFNSTGRGLKATPRAVQIAVPVRAALDIVTGMLSPSSAFDYTEGDREFNLIFSDYGDIVFLGRIMQWIHELGARVRINMHSHKGRDLKEDLHFGEIDMCLWAIPILDGEIHNEHVATETYYSLLRRGHPTVSKSLDLEQYLELDHVLAWYPDPQGNLIDQRLRTMGKKRRKAMRVHTNFDLPLMVSATDMVCSMPSAMATYFADLYDLQMFKTPVPNVEIPIYLMWHSSSELDPGHMWLRNFIIELCHRL